jgi:hypothetical protein
VIHDADRSLAAWLATVLPDGVTITFEPPEPSWAQRSRSESFVGAFLYDIREDSSGLGSGPTAVRAPDGALVARQPPARRYRLSFLLTAWTADVTAGHELLGSVLAGCAAQDALPPGCLDGSLAQAGLPVSLHCAPAGPAAQPLQLWPSLGIPPRTAVILVLTVPLIPVPRTGLAPPVRRLDLDVAAEPGGVSPRGDPHASDGARSAPARERGRITERHS